MNRTYQSWGNWPQHPQAVRQLFYADDPLPPAPWLAVGQQRSQGDSCLCRGGTLVDTTRLNRFLAFDVERGLLTAESGVTLGEILQLSVPQGWFLPVVPGTRFVTLGGAIANDVHGKNHPQQGSFGHHVASLVLRRSDGQVLTADAHQHQPWLAATIGGLGLTGLITQATLRLQPLGQAELLVEHHRQGSLAHFLELADQSRAWEYVISWVDSSAPATALGRGWLTRARWVSEIVTASAKTTPARAGFRLSVPVTPPVSLVNPTSIRAFNLAWRQLPRRRQSHQHYERFLWPLDGLQHWNRLYGRAGFVQCQVVVPTAVAAHVLPAIMQVAQRAGMSFLNTLKLMGDQPPAGVLSFARAGISLAIDLPFRGENTLAAVRAMTELALAAGGAVYPAKDSAMTAAQFQRAFPRWAELQPWRDPAIHSDFWNRVTA